MEKNNKRNFFVALCEYASKNNWCWNLYCTTCGHGPFSIALSKIARGLDPDSDNFWTQGRGKQPALEESELYGDFWRNSTPTIEIQNKLASIVADAKLADIKTVARFPDWLGYIGLVINHCPNHGARKIISDAFSPQFIDMLNKNNDLRKYFEDKQFRGELLSINDLSRIEVGKKDLENPPLPLITDIL